MIGYRFILANNIYWRENQKSLLPISPPKKLEGIGSDKARDLLKSTNNLFIRWEESFDEAVDNNWWHVIRDHKLNMEELSSNTRSKVRRGLKAFKCSPISIDDVLNEGYVVYSNAYKRYDTHEKEYTYNEFTSSIQSLPSQTEFWGVRCKISNQLVAFSENFVEDETCFYNTIWFDVSALRKYSSYALFYEMTNHYLEMRGFQYVSDGARSLSHETQIHDFLESKFGFRKAYASLNVLYVPWLSIVVYCAYPFRNLIAKFPWKVFKKGTILLKHEEIRRVCNTESS